MPVSPNEGGGPIVVGGVGGSGTRVVAELLRSVGVHIGSDLNVALDNLWFTLLFKRPHWLAEAERLGTMEVHQALVLFEKAMVGREPWSADECATLLSAAVAMSECGHDHLGRGRGEWPFVRMARMIDRPPTGLPSGATGWGWKEPNSHVYLEHLATQWPDMRFVLVMRHGLDMAFSDNHAQLHNWGPRFGVQPSGAAELPRDLLRFWLAANTTAIERGEGLLGERFVAVSYDDLCADPATQVPALLERLGRPATAAVERLVAIPVESASNGRHREHDLSIFDERDLAGVRRLGFAV